MLDEAQYKDEIAELAMCGFMWFYEVIVGLKRGTVPDYFRFSLSSLLVFVWELVF